jgi:hypothetical protein
MRLAARARIPAAAGRATRSVAVAAAAALFVSTGPPLAAATPAATSAPAAAAAASPVAATPAATSAPAVATPRVAHEAMVGPRPVGDGRLSDRTFESVVATHPTDPRRIAVAYIREGGVGTCGIDPGLRFSTDGGRTFHDAPRRPWAGSGRGPNIHAAIAWGPGPGGRARLYWVDMTAPGCDYARLQVSVAYTDDEGRTWSRLYTESRMRPSVGGFPEVTVDRDPASPNVGVVYVGYNHREDDRVGPGFGLIASADYGKTWRHVQVPVAARPAGATASWRISYRLRTAPDGTLFAAFYQADLRSWSYAAMFDKGGIGNVVRLGFSVARIRFDRTKGTFAQPVVRSVCRLQRNEYTVYGSAPPGTRTGVAVDPAWMTGLDVDPVTGRLFLAVGEFVPQPGPGSARGSIHLGWSDDGGTHWRWTTMPALPKAGGRLQSAIRPNVVANGGVVVVTMHGLIDMPAGTGVTDAATVGTAYAVSRDGGRTWEGPFPVTKARWSAAAVQLGRNGTGLRERADRAADGSVFLAWGDGRNAGPSRSSTPGACSIYGALIVPGPAREPAPALAVGRVRAL